MHTQSGGWRLPASAHPTNPPWCSDGCRNAAERHKVCVDGFPARVRIDDVHLRRWCGWVGGWVGQGARAAAGACGRRQGAAAAAGSGQQYRRQQASITRPALTLRAQQLAQPERYTPFMPAAVQGAAGQQGGVSGGAPWLAAWPPLCLRAVPAPHPTPTHPPTLDDEVGGVGRVAEVQSEALPPAVLHVLMESIHPDLN